MRFVCITDIHGYLDQAIHALESLEEEIETDLLDGKQWISDDKLILNGDMFDRGPQNRESLEWAFENADVYNIGNHEFFAMFPDVVNEFMSESYFEAHDEEGLYWRDMPEKMRHRLLEKVAEGEITAAFEGPEYVYSHSGSEERSDVEDLNRQLREVGRKLLEAHEKLMNGDEQAFVDAQRYLVEVVETEKGNELKSRYPDLFDVVRDDRGFTATGGIVWNRFYEMESEVPQVIGHTMGSYMVKEGHDWNPQRRGEILNINTIRDYVRGDSDIAVTVEGVEGLEVFTFPAPE
ncbi:metallophosphoesterase [Candidatus Nanohalovita haloferacivicina]|uniref:metallophosphoesterase n=1 Tax=Candidatus Nanohalovita haloferacivicina TaxID=2978046 RepID=UPI00325FB75E|nr:Serine/threonine protein phosphatase PP2A family [Candidatus Nanohalobia archaeon BNXNv]